MTTGDLNSRLPLRRIRSGQYEVPEVPGVGIVQAGRNSWALLRNGQPVGIGPVSEFSSLRELHGMLADRVEAARGARAA